MKKDKKEEWVNNWKSVLNENETLVFFNYHGVDANSLAKTRRDLRNKGVKFAVIKNRLFKLATKGSKLEAVDDLLKNANAIGIYSDPVELAKIAIEISKNYKLTIKGGYTDGSKLSKKDVLELSKVLPREMLLAKLLATLNAPVSGFVFTLSGILRNLIYTIDAIKEKKQNN